MYTPNPELEKLRREKESAEKKIEQYRHKIQRLETERNITRAASEPSAPTVFAIWAAPLKASPRRSKISHAPK